MWDMVILKITQMMFDWSNRNDESLVKFYNLVGKLEVAGAELFMPPTKYQVDLSILKAEDSALSLFGFLNEKRLAKFAKDQEIECNRLDILFKRREVFLSEINEVIVGLKEILISSVARNFSEKTENVFKAAIEKLIKFKLSSLRRINSIEINGLLGKKKIFTILVCVYIIKKKKQDRKRRLSYVGPASINTLFSVLKKIGNLVPETEVQRALFLSSNRFSNGVPFFVDDLEFFIERDKEYKRRIEIAKNIDDYYDEINNEVDFLKSFLLYCRGINKKVRLRSKIRIRDLRWVRVILIRHAWKTHMLPLCKMSDNSLIIDNALFKGE